MSATCVLGALERELDHSGSPTADELSRASGLNRRSVRRTLTLLERVGLIASDDHLHVTNEHVQLQRRIYLTLAGAAAARALSQDQSLQRSEHR